MPNKRNPPDAVCARCAEKRTALRLSVLDAETVLLPVQICNRLSVCKLVHLQICAT
jgi:hypothetical protein